MSKSNPRLTDIDNLLAPGPQVAAGVRELISNGLAVDDPADGLKFAGIGDLIPQIVPQQMQRVRELAGFKKSHISDSFQRWANESFQNVATSDAISEREAGIVPLAVHDLVLVSCIFERLCSEGGPAAHQRYEDALVASFPDGVQAGPGGRFLQTLIPLISHVLGDPANWDEDEPSRIPVYARVATSVGDSMEALPRDARDDDVDAIAQSLTEEGFLTTEYSGDLLLSEETVDNDSKSGRWRQSETELMYRESESDPLVPVPDGTHVNSVDPLDGTYAHKNQLPFAYSSACGRLEQGLPKYFFGIVYLPKSKELFIGSERGGSILIDFLSKRIRRVVSSTNADLSASFLCTHLSSSLSKKQKMLTYLRGGLPRLAQVYQRITMWGVGAMSLVYCADGRVDAFCNPESGGIWDEAGGVQVHLGAGGVVGKYSSAEDGANERGVVAAGNKKHYEMLIRILRMED